MLHKKPVALRTQPLTDDLQRGNGRVPNKQVARRKTRLLLLPRHRRRPHKPHRHKRRQHRPHRRILHRQMAALKHVMRVKPGLQVTRHPPPATLAPERHNDVNALLHHPKLLRKHKVMLQVVDKRVTPLNTRKPRPNELLKDKVK